MKFVYLCRCFAYGIFIFVNTEKTVNSASWRSGSIIIFFILLFAYSKWGPAIPLNLSTQQRGEPLVVTGEGKVTIVPDVAKITLGIEQSGQTLKQVQSEVNQKSQNLTKELKKLGIDGKDIKTVHYNVYPEHDWESPAKKITGYRVSTSYQVTIEEFDKINEVLSITSSLGVNNIGNINFEVNDGTKKDKIQEARELAVEEAKEKANGLAKASGITLGKIINVTENQDQNSPRPLYDSKEVSIGSIEPIQPDIQPGKTEIVVSVSLSYEVR